LPTVVLVDDLDLMRHLVRRVIRDDGRLEVIGEARTGREAIEVVRRERPDAVILDQEMPEMTGIQALPELVALEPTVVVVMFSSGPRPDTEAAAVAAGAHAYFEKSDPVQDVLDAIVDLLAARDAGGVTG
jgi:DNA-binding NarL/FixJ family response regulator